MKKIDDESKRCSQECEDWQMTPNREWKMGEMPRHVPIPPRDKDVDPRMSKLRVFVPIWFGLRIKMIRE